MKQEGNKTKCEFVEEGTSLAKYLRVEHFDSSLRHPKITEVKMKSQPLSRRGSSNSQAVPVQFLLNCKEVAMRASEGYKNQDEELGGEHNRRRDSIMRRGSIKQGSVTRQEEEEETKRQKAELEAMAMLKKAQKEFTWDSVKHHNQVPDVKVKGLV